MLMCITHLLCLFYRRVPYKFKTTLTSTLIDMSLKEKTKKHSAELKAPDVKFKDLSYQVEVRKGK